MDLIQFPIEYSANCWTLTDFSRIFFRFWIANNFCFVLFVNFSFCFALFQSLNAFVYCAHSFVLMWLSCSQSIDWATTVCVGCCCATVYTMLIFLIWILLASILCFVRFAAFILSVEEMSKPLLTIYHFTSDVYNIVLSVDSTSKYIFELNKIYKQKLVSLFQWRLRIKFCSLDFDFPHFITLKKCFRKMLENGWRSTYGL